MYISQVQIDKNNRRVVREISHVGAIHNWVERCFPHEFINEVRTRKLWRIDTFHNHSYLLIISQQKPDHSILEKYGVSGTAKTKDYDSFINNIQNNMRARFRVVLNPVISVKDGTLNRGRVKPHVTVKQQRKFLLDRSEKNGFSLKDSQFEIVDRGYVSLKKDPRREILLSKVTYEGFLTITDRHKFNNILKNGFGKKKAYGFGMITIIPQGQ